MLIDLLVIALAVAFVISAIERFVELPSLRGFVALAFSAIGTWLMDYRYGTLVVLAMAAAFLSLVLVLVGERLATPPPIALERTRRGL